MTIAYACDSMYMCVNFEDDFFFFFGGDNVKLGKNSIFLKNGKTVIVGIVVRSEKIPIL